MRRWSSILLVALGVSPARAQAQADIVAGGITLGYVALSLGAIYSLTRGCCAPVRIGSDVRIATSGVRPDVTGQLLGVDVDSVTVSSAGVVRRVARADVTLMRVKVRESKWAQGWGIGLLAGSAAGVVGGLASPTNNSGLIVLTPPQQAVILGVAGGIVGSSVGALIGLGVDRDTWREADAHAMLARAAVLPIVGRTVGLGIQLQF